MTSMNQWWSGARPRTLPAALAPVAVGTGLAAPDIDAAHALLALTVALFLQVGVNFANDYSDGIRGTDAERVGPTRLVAAALATPTHVKRAALICFLIAGAAGAVLAVRTSLWLLLVGLAAIAAAWFYTGGSRPYGYRGLGEVSVFIFFGIIAVVGTAFVQTQRLEWVYFIAAIPIGFLACALLVVNNLRDRALDAKSGKRTLAVRLGDRPTRALYIFLILSPFVLSLALLLEFPLVWLTLLALPLAIYASRLVGAGARGEDLISALKRTGQLQLVFAALLTLALFL